MIVPGFTAESSLSATIGRYRTPARSDLAHSLSASLSIPYRGGRKHEPCIEGCICVVPEGCPCCDVATSPPVPIHENSTSLTCEPGQEAMCQDWCDHAGGGMSSLPDGSTMCTVYQTTR